MPNVVRFALPTERDLYVSGLGNFHSGILDVPAGDTEMLTRARYLIKPYGAIELGVTDSTTPYPDLPAVGPGDPDPDPYPQYATMEELRAAFEAVGSTAGQAANLWSKVVRGQADAVIAILGDSTGADIPGDLRSGRAVPDWPYLWAQQIAEWFPTHTVLIRPWNEDTDAYTADVTVQTGTGARTITILNGSARGKTPTYTLAFLSTLVPVAPDLVIVNHGHNGANDANTIFRDYRPLLRSLRASYTDAGFVLLTQNPNSSTEVGTTQAQTLDMAQQISVLARQEGAGLINITDLWLSNADWEADLQLDGVHPNDEGAQLWADEVTRALAPNRRAQPAQTRPLNDFVVIPGTVLQPFDATGPELVRSATYGLAGLAFDAGTAESAYADVHIPESWRTWAARIEVTVFSDPAGGAGNSQWNCYTRTLAVDAVAPAWNLMPASGNLKQVAIASGGQGVIKRGQWASGNYTTKGLHQVRISRAAANANDTLTVDAVLLRVVFERVT